MAKTSSTESEKLIFDAVSKGDVHLLKTLLLDKQEVNIFDDDRMTPLQHAAYKGNKEMVQMLLDQGADVNICQHQHGYTALHFAGLSGNSELCALLLMVGAKSQVTNSVGRTPAQMAAFVGNHNCVSVINNFVPKSEVDFYTVPQGQQKSPILPLFLAEGFHKFIMLVNVNPIRIILNIQKIAGLTDHLNEINTVLQLMCTREMSKGNETNEVMAFKFHYLGYVAGELIKYSKNNQTEKSDVFEQLCRKLLKPNKDGNLELMEVFLRESIRSFPIHDCAILRQMVASLTGQDPPSAISIVSSVINGQRGFVDNDTVCATCGEEKPSKKCSRCKAVEYCDKECQKLHWFVHKKTCTQFEGVIQKEPAKPNAAEITADMQNVLIN